MTNAELIDLMTANILSGGKRTTALKVRELVTAIVGSFQNTGDKDQEDGYLGVDSDGNANVALIKSATPLNYVLRDDGSFVKQNTIPLFESYSDVGNTALLETDLVNNTLPASALSTDGDKLTVEYGGTFAAHATATRRIKLYLAGATLFDGGAFATASAVSWTVTSTLIRVDSGKVRLFLKFQYGTTVATSCTEISGLTLGATQVLRITGTAAGAGGATNDIVNKISMVNTIKKA